MKTALQRIPKPAYAAAFVAGLIFLFWAFSTPRKEGPVPGSRAPSLSLADLSGRTVSLSEFHGKVVLLDFWATWCPSCMEGIPTLKAVHEEFAPQGLQILAVSVDEDGPKSVAGFAAKEHLPYRVLFADASSTRDYAVWALPTQYLIDPQGFVYRKYVGEVDRRELEEDIRTLLKRRTS